MTALLYLLLPLHKYVTHLLHVKCIPSMALEVYITYETQVSMVIPRVVNSSGGEEIPPSSGTLSDVLLAIKVFRFINALSI